jgi:hypothetical protein
MSNLLYNENNIIGRLFKYFSIYFTTCYAPTSETLFLLILSILAMESAGSLRSLYRRFLVRITKKSLNAFYHACSYAKVDYTKFMNTTARLALGIVPDDLKSNPIYLCVDDTMVAKFGREFECVSKLYDHASHNGSNYLNGHCFVSLMMCIPVWRDNRVVHISVPLGYRMWRKNETSKLGLAVSMVRQAMPELAGVKNAIILCDSWYAKKDFVCIVDEYTNLDIVCNARHDSVMYDTAPAPTGCRGRPAKRGGRLDINKDFTMSDEKIGDYHVGSKRVITNIFGSREVMAYVTSPDKTGGSRRVFFSTIFPHELQVYCAWYEKPPINRVDSGSMIYLPYLLYSFRWAIEVSYYEQKTFWSFCDYMVRSRKGIEMLVNLINIAYSAMKILPYHDESFSKFRNESVQEFRFALSEQIRQQVFYATFVNNIENSVKSDAILNRLKTLIRWEGYHL